jgi:hypothetical protein
MVSQWCHSGVTALLHLRVSPAPRSLPTGARRGLARRHARSLARVLRECHKNVTRVLQECHKSAMGVLRKCYESVTYARVILRDIDKVFGVTGVSLDTTQHLVLPWCYSGLTVHVM